MNNEKKKKKKKTMSEHRARTKRKQAKKERMQAHLAVVRDPRIAVLEVGEEHDPVSGLRGAR